MINFHGIGRPTPTDRYVRWCEMSTTTTRHRRPLPPRSSLPRIIRAPFDDNGRATSTRRRRFIISCRLPPHACCKPQQAQEAQEMEHLRRHRADRSHHIRWPYVWRRGGRHIQEITGDPTSDDECRRRLKTISSTADATKSRRNNTKPPYVAVYKACADLEARHRERAANPLATDLNVEPVATNAADVNV